jgi:hypothetical protein
MECRPSITDDFEHVGGGETSIRRSWCGPGMGLLCCTCVRINGLFRMGSWTILDEKAVRLGNRLESKSRSVLVRGGEEAIRMMPKRQRAETVLNGPVGGRGSEPEAK